MILKEVCAKCKYYTILYCLAKWLLLKAIVTGGLLSIRENIFEANAIFSKPEDPDSLAQAIITLVSKRNRYQELRSDHRQY